MTTTETAKQDLGESQSTGASKPQVTSATRNDLQPISEIHAEWLKQIEDEGDDAPERTTLEMLR
jgi:hypothetical protein